MSMSRAPALWGVEPRCQYSSPCTLNPKIALKIREMKVLQCVQTLGDVTFRLRCFEHLPVLSSSPFWGRNPVSSHEGRRSLVLADEMRNTTRGALGCQQNGSGQQNLGRTCTLLRLVVATTFGCCIQHLVIRDGIVRNVVGIVEINHIRATAAWA